MDEAATRPDTTVTMIDAEQDAATLNRQRNNPNSGQWSIKCCRFVTPPFALRASAWTLATGDCHRKSAAVIRRGVGLTSLSMSSKGLVACL